jgi:hypothetical protein
MAEVEHPHWRCPRCGIVIYRAGANSLKNRCKVVQGLGGRAVGHFHEGPSAFTVIRHRVLRASYLVYFETAFSSARAWSIWS